MTHKNAIDQIVDPQARARHHDAESEIGRDIFHVHGPDAFHAPRELAVCHETGHVIVAALDGVTIEYSEVFSQSVGKELGAAVAQQVRAMGLPETGWAGFTGFRDSPFPSDMPGKRYEVLTLDLPAFHHLIRMSLGGIAGEMVLYPGAVPAASSIDEKVLSQTACMSRARGNAFIAQTVWCDRLEECLKAIKQNEATARRIIALFDQTDRVDGTALELALSANDNFKRGEQAA